RTAAAQRDAPGADRSAGSESRGAANAGRHEPGADRGAAGDRTAGVAHAGCADAAGRAARSARGGAACASGVGVMAQSIVETGTPPITPPSEHRLWGGRFEASPA